MPGPKDPGTPFVPSDPEKPRPFPDLPHLDVPEETVPHDKPKEESKDLPKTDEDEHEEVTETKIPKGKKELPKTGGLPMALYLSMGCGLGLSGLYLKRQKR